MGFFIIYLVGAVLCMLFGIFVCSSNKDTFSGYHTLTITASLLIVALLWPLAVLAILIAVVVIKTKIHRNAKLVQQKLDEWIK